MAGVPIQMPPGKADTLPDRLPPGKVTLKSRVCFWIVAPTWRLPRRVLVAAPLA